MAAAPRIRKTPLIEGPDIRLRDASVRDAAFIYSLRNDPKKARFLSATPSLESQAAWLEAYEAAEDQAYFIIEDLAGKPLGTIRLYGANRDSFTWGSWALVDDAGPIAPIESVMLTYRYARTLGFLRARFAVFKANAGVCRFAETMLGAERVRETELEYEYAVPPAAFDRTLARHRRFWAKD